MNLTPEQRAEFNALVAQTLADIRRVNGMAGGINLEAAWVRQLQEKVLAGTSK